MSRALLLASFLLAFSHAQAAHEAPAARTPSASEVRTTLAAMPRGNVTRGQALNQRLMCASCHGADGVAPTQNWASLAGQRAVYTYKSLIDYQKNGRHENARATLMQVAVADMSRQDMADVAAYYASLPLPKPAIALLDASTYARIDRLARHGDPARLLTPCASCHGAAGQGGVNETPALAGQTPGSLMRTLLDYRAGRRITDAHQGMRQFARQLSTQEIRELAMYYSAMSKR